MNIDIYAVTLRQIIQSIAIAFSLKFKDVLVYMCLCDFGFLCDHFRLLYQYHDNCCNNCPVASHCNALVQQSLFVCLPVGRSVCPTCGWHSCPCWKCWQHLINYSFIRTFIQSCSSQSVQAGCPSQSAWNSEQMLIFIKRQVFSIFFVCVFLFSFFFIYFAVYGTDNKCNFMSACRSLVLIFIMVRNEG